MTEEQLDTAIAEIPNLDRMELEGRCAWLERAYANRVWSWGRDRREAFSEGFFSGIGAGFIATLFVVYWVFV